MNVNKQNFPIRLSEIACFFFGIGCFFSIALKNICLGVCLLCFLVLFRYNKGLQRTVILNLKKNPYSWVCLILGFVAFAGIFYSYASFSRAWAIFFKYARLAFLPIVFIPFFYTFRSVMKSSLYGLLLGMVLFVLVHYITLRQNINFRPINPIYINILFCMVSVYCFISALGQEIARKIFYTLFWLLGVVFLFMLNQQRTGVFMILITHFLFSILLSFKLIRGKRTFLLSWGVFTLLCFAYAYGTKREICISRFNEFNKKVLAITDNTIPINKPQSNTMPVKTSRGDTSPVDKNLFLVPETITGYHAMFIKTKSFLGSLIYSISPARLGFLKIGLVFFKEKPWLGHGTGSWAPLVVKHKELYLDKAADMKCNIPNPHNEWINVVVQWGIVGVVVVVFWLFMPWLFAQQKGFTFLDKTLLFLWPVMFLLAGISDIVLFISTTRDFYLITLAAIFANACYKKEVYRTKENIPGV